MNVSVNWLKDYLNLKNISDEELFKAISLHICEIEEMKKLVTVTNLTIGHVIECVPHPDSDHLHVCKVELKDQVNQIVCGAPNVSANQKVIVALPGAQFKDFAIKPSKIRGVESNGMICSLQELGIEDKYVPEAFKNGIYILPDDAKVGDSPLEYLGLDDTVIDLDLTSNRSDLLSIVGVAYDLGAALDQKVKKQVIKPYKENNYIDVKIDTPKCGKYYALRVNDVVIKESPIWLKERLIASGIRPINNVVDITNYVLMEQGNPLHAFDADKLGNKILVREANDSETLVTLDGISRKLATGDIVITDGKTPLCVAGVMGGLSTFVTNETKNIVIESAYFDPLSIRRTSSRLNLKSDSSIRFERKIDSKRVIDALYRAGNLLEELASAKIVGLTKIDNMDETPKTITISTSDINKVLGTDLDTLAIEKIFDRLAYEYKKNNETFVITIPDRRMDLECSKQDIIEDVVRIYGYDLVPTTLAATDSVGGLSYTQKRMRDLRCLISDMGFNEAVTYSLEDEKRINDFSLDTTGEIKPLMPMTEDRAVMRKSLLNGLLGALEYNLARKNSDLAFFEIGNKYNVSGQEPLLALAITGLYQSKLWGGYKKPADFFLLKGILDSIFERLNVTVKYVESDKYSNIHPYQQALIMYKDKEIGFIGAVHPKYCKKYDLTPTYVAEIALTDILNNESSFVYKPINRFPSITRDLAIVCKKDIKAQDIIDCIKQTAKKTLAHIEIFDLYEGENIASDEKSLAVSLRLEDSLKTLTTEDADKTIKSVLNRLDFNFKARLR